MLSAGAYEEGAFAGAAQTWAFEDPEDANVAIGAEERAQQARAQAVATRCRTSHAGG